MNAELLRLADRLESLNTRQSDVGGIAVAVERKTLNGFASELRTLAARESSPEGAGTPVARLTHLLDELAKLFPEAHKPLSAEPPEIRYLAAITALLTKDTP